VGASSTHNMFSLSLGRYGIVGHAHWSSWSCVFVFDYIYIYTYIHTHTHTYSLLGWFPIVMG
jgi:hypothetical protein